MAYIPMTTGGGNAKLVETVLWSNSSPTSNFAAQTITLSDDLTKYDYVKFTFKKSANSNYVQSTIFKVSEFITYKDTESSGRLTALIGSRVATGGTRMHRPVYMGSDNYKIDFNAASTSSGDNNAYIVPVAIFGMKLTPVKAGSSEIELLWTNPNPTSVFASQTIPIDVVPYDYILIIEKRSKSLAISNVTGRATVRSLIKVDNNFNVDNVLIASSDDDSTAYRRKVQLRADGIYFASVSEGYGIPVYIYGIKSDVIIA